jgi:hypothetical protein
MLKTEAKVSVVYEEGCDEEMQRVSAETPDIAALIDERNQWYETGDFGDALNSELNRRNAHSVLQIFEYISRHGGFDTVLGDVRAIIEFKSFLYVFFPHLLVGKNGEMLSLEASGAALGRSRCWMSMVAEKISRVFSFFNRNQKTLASRPNYAAGAAKGWAKRWAALEAAEEETVPIIPQSKKRKSTKQRR